MNKNVPVPYRKKLGSIKRNWKHLEELDNLKEQRDNYFAENKLDRFCTDFKVRYLTEPAGRPRQTSFPIIYQDNTAIIYDLKNSPNC